MKTLLPLITVSKTVGQTSHESSLQDVPTTYFGMRKTADQLKYRRPISTKDRSSRSGCRSVRHVDALSGDDAEDSRLLTTSDNRQPKDIESLRQLITTSMHNQGSALR